MAWFSAELNIYKTETFQLFRPLQEYYCLGHNNNNNNNNNRKRIGIYYLIVNLGNSLQTSNTNRHLMI